MRNSLRAIVTRSELPVEAAAKPCNRRGQGERPIKPNVVDNWHMFINISRRVHHLELGQ
jgi:hypothetical protein